jgi:hypothetical protein
MRVSADRRGSATRGAPLRCAAAWLVLACVTAHAAVAGVRGAPERPARPGAQDGRLVYAGLAWDAGADDVAARLAALGFAPVPATAESPAAWRGEAFARPARLATETDREGRLVAVTLRFEPDARGSALQRYGRLVDAARRRHGAWTVQVAPGRPVDEERLGRFAMTRRFGPLTAATLWTDEAGGAAAVQLDGDGVLWLRYESPRWEAASREREDAGR